MNLLQMTVSAGLLVIAIIIIRAVALNRLPKKMFLILWSVVLVRLLVPFTIPININISNSVIGGIVERMPPNSPVYPVVENTMSNVMPGATPDFLIIPEMFEMPGTTEASSIAAGQTASPPQREVFTIAPSTLIWLVGMIATLAFFAVLYFKVRRTLRFATIIKDNDFMNKWLMEHRLKRPIVIMQSDRIKSPLAVGIVSPRIVLPKSINLNDKQLLNYVLNHEYYHIKRFDALWKIILLFAVCIHWFNPIIWIMFVLANRDLEITCDEAIVKRFGEKTKKSYAYMLINMAEQKGAFAPLYSGFSKNATEERIVSIMKMKKTSIIGMVIAFALVPVLTIVALSMLFSPPISDDVDAAIDCQITNLSEVDAAIDCPTTNLSEENAHTNYEASTTDIPNISNPIGTNRPPAVEAHHLTATPLKWGEGIREEKRIDFFQFRPGMAEVETDAFLLKLRAYLVELILQGDIQDHILDFTCELSPGSELSVRINETLEEQSGVGRTGNTREVNGLIQREMLQVRNAVIECSNTPGAAIVSVTWNETWWEDAHLYIEYSPLGIIREDDTPVFITHMDTEPILCNDAYLMGINQGAFVLLISNECYNGKVFVLVTSAGGETVHNGWRRWTLWIPCDSFELVGGELLCDEISFCICE